MSTAESERLLIADDDPNLLAAYVLFFQAYGCEIRADDLAAWTRARRLATLFGPRGCRAAQSWDQLAIPARYVLYQYVLMNRAMRMPRCVMVCAMPSGVLLHHSPPSSPRPETTAR
jgi:hypothetical protein